MRTREEELERAAAFWHFRVIRRPGQCWGWTANRDKDGYGTITVARVPKRATHIAWFAFYGELPPKGMLVMHSCDNPECTNPDHLRLGTHKENMQDKIAKKRDLRANGLHFNSKVTPEQVRYLRASYPAKPLEVLAEEIGISRAQVWQIAAGNSHKSII